MEPLLNLLIPKKIGLSSEEMNDSLKGEKKTGTRIILSREETTSLELICVNVAIAAFQHYLQRDLLEFDALVGENACQIRASLLQEIMLNGSVDEGRLAHLITKLEAIRESLLAGQVPKKEDELQELKDQEKYLILAHLLTHVRHPQNKLKTNESLLNTLSSGGNLRIIPLVELTYHAKRILSQLSVTYVQGMAAQTPLLKKITSQVEDANSQGLKCTALYYNLQLLLDNLKQNHRLLVLNIGGEHKLVFRADETGALKRVEDPTSLRNEPAFVIFYKINQRDNMMPVIDSFMTHPEERILPFVLADAADHPLFAGHDKKKGIKMFQHQDVKPYLKLCKGLTEDEIRAKLKQEPPKKIRVAEVACRPLPLVEMILAHRLYKLAKAEGKENKKIIHIIHIYCNGLLSELNSNQHIASEKGIEK